MKKSYREIVFNKFNGHCAYCGCELQKGWNADHLKPVVRSPLTGLMSKKEHDNIDNLMPSCPSCNNYKHSYSLEDFRRLIGDLKKQLRLSSQYKIALRYGLISENDTEVKFYFEKF